MGRHIDPVSIRREASGPLSAIETITLDCLRSIAEQGRRATRCEIAAAIGTSNVEGGTVAGILRRLERKGKIATTIYQRGMMICLTDSGLCTLPPPCLAPHWRNRTDRPPSPAIQSVRAKSEDTFMQIAADAKARGVSIADHLSDLVYIGHHAYREERDNG